MEPLISLAIGDEETFTKTVGESDVYLFAGITGDLHRNHVDEQHMAKTRYGGRIAHGALVIGYMSAASTLMLNRSGRDAVSYGWDGVRFILPVRIGDTLTITYTVTELLPEKRQTRSKVTAVNQDGALVTVATHIAYFMPIEEQVAVR